MVPPVNAGVQGRWGRQGVLLVEDDGLVARAIARWLRGRQYEVTIVRTGNHALLADGPFAAMIFDIELPDGSGVDFAEQARRSGRAEPIVFFSACRDESMLRRAHAIGTLVDKSGDIDELGRALERLVRPASRGAAKELAPAVPPKGPRSDRRGSARPRDRS